MIHVSFACEPFHKRSLVRDIFRDRLAVLLFAVFVAIYLAGLRDVGSLFFPYRWPMLLVLACGMLGLLARATWIPQRPEHYCFYGLMAFSAISCVISPMPDYSFARLLTLILAFIIVFLGAWLWLQRPRSVSVVAGLLVLAASVGAVFSLYYLMQQESFIPSGRVTGAFGKATGTGSFAAGSLPIILWKIRASRGWARVFFLGVLAILLYLLVFSGARAAIIGGTCALILWLWKHHRALRPILAGGIFFVSALVTIGVLTLDMLPDYIVRKDSLPTFTGRIPRWKVGIALFLESPVIGHGYGMTRYIRLYEDGENLRGVIVPGTFSFLELLPGSQRQWGRMTLHSDHVERLVETGLIGYIPFLLFWFYLMGRFVRLLWLPVTLDRSLAIALGLNVSYKFLDTFSHGAFFAINAPGTILAWLACATFMAASERAEGLARVTNAYPPRHSQCG